jgi:hypothetical protein
MNSRPPGDRADYETAINALIDGELDAVAAAELKAAAAGDRVLAQAIVDAWRLQKGLDELRLERAPSTLRQALKRIPREQSRAGATSAWPRRLAAGAFASVVLVAFAMMMATSKERPATGDPDAGELARVEAARRDLAIAFHYLDKVGSRTGDRIHNVLHEQVAEPVTEQISRHLPYTEQSRKEEHS